MTTHQNLLEIEVKFHLAQPDVIQQRLLDLGAIAQPKSFELNLRFEDSDHNLKTGDKLLRLRRDESCRLTFKSKPTAMDSECKVYHELEVTVSDFDTMEGILNALGFSAVQTYEKWRQRFLWKDVELCLDTMPYGSFLEIEGSEAGIKSAAAILNMPWERRILTNYLAMFEALRKYHKLPFNDVTFSNFEKHPADISSLLDEFEAG